jgi:hypothetical protein
VPAVQADELRALAHAQYALLKADSLNGSLDGIAPEDLFTMAFAAGACWAFKRADAMLAEHLPQWKPK